MTNKSLKRDEEKKTVKNVIAKRKETKDTRYTEYVFEKGMTIDCFHRLRLTSDNLLLLKKIFKKEKQIDKLRENYGRGHKKLIDELSELWENFHEDFTNPYKLDIEWIQDKPLFCVFYDGDYLYELKHYGKEWGVTCQRSFNNDTEGTYVDMDTP